MSTNHPDSKRTRSQLALSNHILRVPLTRSPLKDARTAIRNQPHPLSTPERETSKLTANDGDDSEDEILLSPRKKSKAKLNTNQSSSPTSSLGTKRPSSPSEEEFTTGVHTPGPNRKRARHDDPPIDIEDTQNRDPRTPVRVVSVPSLTGTAKKTRSRAATPSASPSKLVSSIGGAYKNISNPSSNGLNADGPPSSTILLSCAQLESRAVTQSLCAHQELAAMENCNAPSVDAHINSLEVNDPTQGTGDEAVPGGGKIDAEGRDDAMDTDVPEESDTCPTSLHTNQLLTPHFPTTSLVPTTLLSPLTPLPPTPHPLRDKRPIPSTLQKDIITKLEHQSQIRSDAPTETTVPPAVVGPPANISTLIQRDQSHPGPPASSVNIQRPPQTSISTSKHPSASSISLAKALGPKTAAKLSASSAAGKATIAQLLGAAVIPKANKPTSNAASAVPPNQQREKIKTKMRMREKTTSATFSFGMRIGGGSGVVTRSEPVKKVKVQPPSQPGKPTSLASTSRPTAAPNPPAGTTSNAKVAEASGQAASTTSDAKPATASDQTTNITSKANLATESAQFAVLPQSALPLSAPTVTTTTIPPFNPTTNITKAIVNTSTKPAAASGSPVKPKSTSIFSLPPKRLDSSTNSNSNSNSTSTTGVSTTTTRRTGHAMSPTKASLARAVSIPIPAHSPFKQRTRPVFPQRPPSSLSTLASALEKLTMPPPSRPNTGVHGPRPSTSMGFNPDLHDADEEGGQAVAGRAADDADLGRSSAGVLNLKRANTVDPGLLAKSVADDASKMATGGSEPSTSARPNIGTVKTPGQKTLNSWMLGGNARGATRLGPAGARQRMFVGGGRGSIRGIGGMGRFGIGAGRATQKVSRKTSLPSVVDSPVKGAHVGGESEQIGEAETGTGQTEELRDEDIFMDIGGSERDANALMGKEKERALGGWSKNASLRASLASQALSQSLSSLPAAQPNPSTGSMGPPETPAGNGRGESASGSPKGIQASNSGTQMGLRSSARIALAMAKSAPGALGKIRGGEGGHVSSERKGAREEKAVKGEGTLGVLKSCTIFVDVKTDNGDDAGDLFVQMLKGLGAKILTRVGQTCTHIVYKNGLMSTLTRYRLLNDPKPAVVGIAWVVECVEQRMCVDAEKFKVDVEHENIAGINKRRRSMLPKHMPVSVDSRSDEPGTQPDGEDGDRSGEGGSASIDDDLPPLEKARLRRMLLAPR